MIILTIRTDKPEAEIGFYEDGKQLAYEVWTAHRQLAETLHDRIRQLLERHGKGLSDLNGIVAYEGPGSFTGLRIGLTVANALAYAERLPIVAETGDNWRQDGIARLIGGDDEKLAMPAYGADVHITTPKH